MHTGRHLIWISGALCACCLLAVACTPPGGTSSDLSQTTTGLSDPTTAVTAPSADSGGDSGNSATGTADSPSADPTAVPSSEEADPTASAATDPDNVATVPSSWLMAAGGQPQRPFLLSAGPSVFTVHPVLGDVDGSGKINSSDARLVLQATVELRELTSEQQLLADVDQNGRINSSDARQILRMATGSSDPSDPDDSTTSTGTRGTDEDGFIDGWY